MKKIFSVTLGIVTGVGGFLDVGSIVTSAQAGAEFGYALLWPLLLGTVCVIFLVEMSGRFAAVTGCTVVDAVRSRFRGRVFMLAFAAATLVHLLVLAAEIGGVCVALELATGVGVRVWVLPVALAIWLLLWLGTFDVIENGVALLGLVTLSFVVAALMLRPDWTEVAAGFVPSLPSAGRAHYLFLAVSILGATIAPYLFFFYSSGAIEDRWNASYVGANRVVATLGMGFGSVASMAVLVVAAVVLQPHGVRVEGYGDIAGTLVPALGPAGFWWFAASLGIACFGAALELALVLGYTTAQAFGWSWGENRKRARPARFSAVYSAAIALAAAILLAGADPLRLTMSSMALTAVILPATVAPFLVLMNDRRTLGEHRNGRVSNAVVAFTIVLSFVLAVVAIPLQILGGD